MKKSFLLFLLLSCAFLHVPETHAQSFIDLAGLSPYTHYKTFETAHFKFIYQDGYFDFTARAAEHLEHAHAILSPILQWQPRYKTDILVADNEDDANGFTMPALRVGIVLIATPPDAWLSTSYSDDWIKLLVFHEYTHFLNIDPTRGLMEAARIFFGDIIRPNGLWPVWMLEGLAVYFETRTSTLGRGRSPYYDGILRAYVNDNRLGTRENRGMTLDRVNGTDPYFPGGEIPYLFGYHLWDTFTRDHARYPDTDHAIGDYSFNSSYRIPFFIEGNLDNVMGKHWKDYWATFVEDSKTRLNKEIEIVKNSGETPSTLLTHAQTSAYLGDISQNGEWLAYTESSLHDLSRLVLINLRTKETRRLDEKNLGVGMSFTPDSNYLVYSSLTRTNTYSFFSDLYLYDVKKDHEIQLSAGLRGKDPALSPDGKTVAFVTSDKATNFIKIADLVQTKDDFSLQNIRTLYAPSEFGIVSNPRFLNSGEVVFSRQEIGQAYSDLVAVHIGTGKTRILISDLFMNRTPYTVGGDLYYVSDKNGIENVYVMRSGTTIPEVVTNVITGVTLPVVTPDGNLYASELTSDGYEIAAFDKPHPRNDLEKVGSPPAPESLTEALKPPALHFDHEVSKDYSPWSSLAPRQWAPVTYVNYNANSGVSLLGTVLGFDSTGKHQYFGYFGYNFKPSTVDGYFSYTYSGFRPILTLTASSVTTDIATDINHSNFRNNSEVSLSLSYPVRFTYSSLTPSIYGFADWNRVYDLQTKSQLPSDDFEYSKPIVPGFGASLQYSDAQTTRLGFVPEFGNDVLVAAEDRINVDQYSMVKYLAQYSHYFNLGDHQVLQPRARLLGSTYPIGYTSAARVQGPNTTDIYDQGTGVNLNEVELRGYDYYYYLLTRQTYVASLDYHFPIWKVFGGIANTAPFFLNQVHGFLFGESAYVPSQKIKNLFLPSFGGGISADTQLFIRIPVTVSLQIQNGTRTEYGGDTLFFLSLQGGSLF